MPRMGGLQVLHHLAESNQSNFPAVLLIDHNVALIMEVCDRIHVLDRGRTLAEGTPDEIRSNFDVATAYLGAVL